MEGAIKLSDLTTHLFCVSNSVFQESDIEKFNEIAISHEKAIFDLFFSLHITNSDFTIVYQLLRDDMLIETLDGMDELMHILRDNFGKNYYTLRNNYIRSLIKNYIEYHGRQLSFEDITPEAKGL